MYVTAVTITLAIRICASNPRLKLLTSNVFSR